MTKRRLTALAFAVGIAVAAAAVLANDTDDRAVPQATPTATLQPEAAAADVIQRFIDGLSSHDVGALYNLQEDAYKRACDLAGFEAIADRLRSQPLEGPARVVVGGDRAAASLLEVQPDGSKRRVVIQLVKEADGSWRIASPTTTGCTP